MSSMAPPLSCLCSRWHIRPKPTPLLCRGLLLTNNQLLLFPALLRVWYCLEGHDSLLAVCCMPEPTAGAGYLPVIGLRERRPWNPRILISRPHTYSCLGTGYCRHRADNRGVYDSLLWGGTSWNLLPTEHFTKERKER